MYIIRIKVIMDDGTVKENTMPYWSDAASWIQYLADNSEGLPQHVTMEMVTQ